MDAEVASSTCLYIIFCIGIHRNTHVYHMYAYIFQITSCYHLNTIAKLQKSHIVITGSRQAEMQLQIYKSPSTRQRISFRCRINTKGGTKPHAKNQLYPVCRILPEPNTLNTTKPPKPEKLNFYTDLKHQRNQSIQLVFSPSKFATQNGK